MLSDGEAESIKGSIKKFLIQKMISLSRVQVWLLLENQFYRENED